jgi:hypothetical protein
MTFLINQVIFSLFSFVNACGDYSLIKENKPVNHFKNGLIYLLLIFIWITCFKMKTLDAVAFTICSLCNRQLTFDIPLNLMRDKQWNYVSSDPSSWFDRLEVRIWGNDGIKPNIVYSLVFILITVSYLIF